MHPMEFWEIQGSLFMSKMAVCVLGHFPSKGANLNASTIFIMWITVIWLKDQTQENDYSNSNLGQIQMQVFFFNMVFKAEYNNEIEDNRMITAFQRLMQYGITWISIIIIIVVIIIWKWEWQYRADSMLAPSQWEKVKPSLIGWAQT